SNQAATGLVLSELSGSGAPAQAPRAAPTRVTAAPHAAGSIEVIRGGRAETLAY
ncbi:Flp pilus assembly protein CpaB, partial [Burkholderia pseudomallei]